MEFLSIFCLSFPLSSLLLYMIVAVFNKAKSASALDEGIDN